MLEKDVVGALLVAACQGRAMVTLSEFRKFMKNKQVEAHARACMGRVPPAPEVDVFFQSAGPLYDGRIVRGHGEGAPPQPRCS